MSELTIPLRTYGSKARGVTNLDIDRAADELLRSGERPTIERVRKKLGTGSPNTINPLLDIWWKKLAARLDSGPAALHRLPESVAHLAEGLWLQALDEGRRRAIIELQGGARASAVGQQQLEVRAQVLSLREDELDSRLRNRDLANSHLELQLHKLTTLLRKEQLVRESQARRYCDSRRRANGANANASLNSLATEDGCTLATTTKKNVMSKNVHLKR